MKLSAPTALLLSLLALPVAVAFDFTPRVMETTFLDGRVYIAEYFENNGVYYRPSLDGTTTLSGGNGKATILFTDLEGADLRLETSPLRPSQVFDDEDAKPYREAAARYAPTGGSLTEQKAESFRAFSQLELSAFAVTSTYQLPVGVVLQQVVFINYLPEEQVVMVTTAFEQDAEKAFGKAVSFMHGLRQVSQESLKQPEAF